MNKKIGFISAIILAITVVIFFMTLMLWLIFRDRIYSMISYFSCIFLSFSYLLTIVSSNNFIKEDRKVAGEAGKVFAIIYSVFISLVYFTQLTAIKNGIISNELLKIFDFTYPGSLLFSIDLVGYGIMALSTFFIGLTIEPQNSADKVLKILLLVHGIFIVSMFLPMTKIFINGGESGAIYGTVALLFWCLFFTPIAILFAIKFKNIE